MAVNLIRSTRLSPGAPYAYAATARPPGLTFTAGACPLDGQGNVVAPAEVRAQMRQALGNLRIALAESGAAITDVLETTVYVASRDRDDLIAAWREVAGFFGDHDAPSTLLGVAVLGYRASWPDGGGRGQVAAPAGAEMTGDRRPAQHEAAEAFGEAVLGCWDECAPAA